MTEPRGFPPPRGPLRAARGGQERELQEESALPLPASREQEAREQSAPSQAERAERLGLSPSDRALYAYSRAFNPEREPAPDHFDPESSVAIWRERAPGFERYSVLVTDDHCGEAPSLGEAIRIGLLACFQEFGEKRAHLGLTWWLARQPDNEAEEMSDPLPLALDPHAPGFAALFTDAWREYSEQPVTISLTVSLPRDYLESVVRGLSGEAQERIRKGEPGGPDEVLAQALSEAVDEASS